MRVLPAIVLCALAVASCHDTPDDRIKLTVCGDLVVPDEVDTLRISVIERNGDERDARLYVLGVADDDDTPAVADLTPTPEAQSEEEPLMGGAAADESDLSEPRAKEGWFGDPCVENSDCRHGRAECLTAEDGFPGGACVKKCGDAAGGCPGRPGAPKAYCVLMQGVESGRCLAQCDEDILSQNAGCRTGYACKELPDQSDDTPRRVCVQGEPEPIAAMMDEEPIVPETQMSPPPKVARPKGSTISPCIESLLIKIPPGFVSKVTFRADVSSWPR